MRKRLATDQHGRDTEKYQDRRKIIAGLFLLSLFRVPSVLIRGQGREALMPPPTVLGAVFEVLAGSAPLNALINGRYWLSQAPPEATLPYIVVEHQGETPTWTSEPGYLEETRLRFTVLASRDPTQPTTAIVHPAEFCEQIMLALKAALLDQPLDVANASSVKFRWNRYNVALDPNVSPEGERVYRGTLDVTAMIERQRVIPGG